MASLRSIPDWIESTAAIRSEAVALTHGDSLLSYGELDRRATLFARHLQCLGVGAGNTVALCTERSFDWVVAALGIMLAGAAYAPLDIAWPDIRLRYAVDDCGATVLVARKPLLDRLQTMTHGVDPTWGSWEPVNNPLATLPEIIPESLAYVIYTSGSAGKPKGVEITHANLSHLIKWYQDRFQVKAQDRVSHLLGLGFDAAVLEVWAHLCGGANLFFAEEDIRMSPGLVQKWMLDQKLTIALVPTIVGAQLMNMEWPVDSPMRLLIVGGEALRKGPVNPLPFDLVNQYGPSECTVVSTFSVVRAGGGDIPTIGRPISGAAVYLLGEDGNRVPDGDIGEIYIGGDCVGRGYRNLPELTRQKFLPDPFAVSAEARMYRSGDRGRRLPDGDIEFHGRLDRQAKLRGFRIELDEISAVLQEHRALAFAIVSLQQSDAGEDELVAHVLLSEEHSVVSSTELQAHLLERLPDYMVPSIFVRLHSIPLSPNGKVDLDRLSLPGMGQRLERAGTTPVSLPRAISPVKERLLDLVRELVHSTSIVPEDNFFLVGGHSLLGMQLLMRLKNTFGVEITLRQLFQAPSVERLAGLLESMMKQQRLTAIWRELLLVNAISADDNFFESGGKVELLISLQRRIEQEFGQYLPIDQLLANLTLRKQADLLRDSIDMGPLFPSGVLALQPKGTRKGIFWIHYFNVNLARLVGEDQPFLVVRLMAEDFATLPSVPTLEEIAARHVHKILSTQAKGPYTIGGLCLGAILAFAIAQQLQSAGHEVALLVMLDPPSPSYLGSPAGLSPRLSQPQYLLRRAARLGIRRSFMKLRKRILGHLGRSPKKQAPSTEIEIAQELIELAAATYQPDTYEGRVLLLLASERPPHLDFLPEWQTLVPINLHTQYLDGHHEELTRGLSAQVVADAIFSHLSQASEQNEAQMALAGRG